MKKTILSFALSFVSLLVCAGNVTEQEALRKAQQFMQGRSFQQKNLRRAATANTFAQDAFYVFNADGNQGFVIVSADDRTEAILGYSDAGSIDLNRLPANAAAWLQDYAHQIQSLDEGVNLAAPHRAPGTEKVLMKTAKWNQEEPYNGMCPKDDKGQCYTGCAATAMAIVMKYYEWPKSVKGLDAYTVPEKDGKKGFDVGELPAATFDYTLLKDEYDSDDKKYTDADSAEVAKLMRYCGQSVEMAYSSVVSLADIHAKTMVNYFGFSPCAREINRSAFTNSEWEKIIYDEIVAKRVVIYGGYGLGVGHQFVIDGYDGKGLFHVNWGWGGTADGYFTLSTLNPSVKDIAGYSYDNGYSMWQEAIVGLKKPAEGDVPSESVVMNSTELGRGFTAEYDRNSPTEDFQDVALCSYFKSLGNSDEKIKYKIEAWQNGEKKGDVLKETAFDLISCKSLHSITKSSFGSDLADGTYELRTFYQIVGKGEWKEPTPDYIASTVTAEIAGNELTLTCHRPMPYKINSGIMEGDFVVNRPMTVTINWTRPKNNNANENKFYLWLDGDAKPVAAMSSNVAKGESETLIMVFKPSRTGKCYYYITSDPDGDDGTIYEFEDVTIVDVKQQQLRYDKWYGPNFSDDGKILKALDFQVEVSLTNQGSNDYYDYVVLGLTPVDGNNKATGETKSMRCMLDLKAGSSTGTNPVQATFTNLTNNQRYKFEVSYYTNEGATYYKTFDESYFTVNTSTGINAVKAGEKGDAPIYNLNGQRVSSPKKGIFIKNGKKYVVK